MQTRVKGGIATANDPQIAVQCAAKIRLRLGIERGLYAIILAESIKRQATV
jgi:hypothetical protein